jgi:hypothetical protein
MSKNTEQSGMVMHTCNPSIWEAEAGGSPVQGKPGLQNDIISKKKRKQQNDF